jgi:hypothetical protein
LYAGPVPPPLNPPAAPVTVPVQAPTDGVSMFSDVIGVCALTKQDVNPAMKTAAKTETNFMS